MNFRQLTSTGDWTFGGGLANYASGTQAIALNIQTSVLMWQGDFFASLSGWVNWKGLMQVGTQKQLNGVEISVINHPVILFLLLFHGQGDFSRNIRFCFYDDSEIKTPQVINLPRSSREIKSRSRIRGVGAHPRLWIAASALSWGNSSG